jgi:hypothetical protein
VRLHAPALVLSPFGGVATAAAQSPRSGRPRTPLQSLAPAVAERRTLTECLVLAALLHLLLVLLVGNVPGGNARPGAGAAGSLSVTLRGYGALRDEPLRAMPAPTAAAPALAPSRSRDRGHVPPVEPPAARQLEAEPSAPAVVAPRPMPEATTAPSPTDAATPAPPPLPAIEPPPLPTVEPEQPAPEPAARSTTAAPIVESPPSATIEPSPAVPIATPLAPPKPVLEAPPPTAPAVAPVAPPLPVPELELPTPSTPTITTPPTAAPAPPVAAPPTPTPAAEPRGVEAAKSAARTSATVAPGGEPDVAPPPSASGASAPPLNLELPRSRGGELSRRAAPGLLPLLPRPPERPSKLATDIDNAAKPDCRTAYASMGLLAAAPLVAQAATGAGCRW